MPNPPFEATELLLDEDTIDPAVQGGIKHVNGALRGKDDAGVFDLRLGGGSYLTVAAGKNQNPVTPGTYLSTIDGMSTHPLASPPAVPYKATITAATIAVDNDTPPGSAWAIEILVNGVLSFTLSQPNGAIVLFSTDTLSVDISAGDRLSIRNAVTGSVNIAFPWVTMALRLRK